MAYDKYDFIDDFKQWPDELNRITVNKKPCDDITPDYKPILIEMIDQESEEELKRISFKVPIESIIDNYSDQYIDLVLSRKTELYYLPKENRAPLLRNELARHYDGIESWKKGAWIYYPWSKQLIHILARDDFYELKTARNRNLIRSEEQNKIYEFNVGIAGMSVGSNVALGVNTIGCSRRLKITDKALFCGSNLNRVNIAGIGDIGESKTNIVSRRLYEMNPYIEIESVSSGVNLDNIDNFFEKPWKLDLVVDEIDDFETKVRLRMKAREMRIPLLMISDNADSCVAHVERYDLDSKLPLFHGLIGDIENIVANRKLTYEEIVRYSVIVGNVSDSSLRFQEDIKSAMEGKALIPQLGSTAMLSGAVAAYIIRKIALGEDVRSGQTIISFDDLLMGKV